MTHKLIRVSSLFIDSYSLYFNFLPPQRRLERLSSFAKIANGVKIAKKIIVPTPEYLEICNNVEIQELHIAPKKYILIEKDVKAKTVHCQRHTIITKKRIYEGKELPGNTTTISVDFEGGVALSHAAFEDWDYLKNFWESRKAVEELAKLFKKYDIPVTWAICGHLFLRECNGQHDILEEDWFGDWFKYDPATNHSNNSAWYMPEVIHILTEEPLFEVGYHSFGHYFYQKCSEDTVKKDIFMAQKIRDDWGLKLETFVFPYNQVGYLDLLVEEGGFRNFRGNIGLVYPAFGIFDFENFRYFNTTQMFSPETMEICFVQLDSLPGATANYYTHCYQWIEKDGWRSLENWLRELSRLRDSKKISIRSFQEI